MPRWPEAGIPVLLVWGKQDPTVAPLANAEERQAGHPRPRVLRGRPESGHLPQMEQTTAFDAHLFAFLDAHPPGAR